MNDQVTLYITELSQKWQSEFCTRVREMVHRVVPDVTERLQYGKPHFLQGKQYVGVLSAAKAHVSFTIFNAQLLETPEGLFESSETGDRRTLKVKDGQTVDYEMLEKLFKQAATT